jgi:hypothetical protein
MILVDIDILVGMTGFEPATSCSQSRRATKLRYIPLGFRTLNRIAQFN